MKILIIDDSKLDIKLISNDIRNGGFDNPILIAKNGLEGLKVLEENKDDICVIILDWEMPVMDGLEFLKRAKQLEDISHIAIFMVTVADTDKCRNLAIDTYPSLEGYMGKPYVDTRLIEMISGFIK